MLSTELYQITSSILSHDLVPALKWCEANRKFLSSPPHPSALPYYLHRAVFKSLSDPAEAITYARRHMMIYVPTQPVLKLITSCLYDKDKAKEKSGNGDVEMGNGDGDGDGDAKKEDEGEDMEGLVKMFTAEFCRRYQWPKEDPLEVAVDLGSRGGALNVIEKARRVMGEHLGHVRKWTDLPVCRLEFKISKAT